MTLGNVPPAQYEQHHYAALNPDTRAAAHMRAAENPGRFTCFRQVEHAGVLEGAENPEGAQTVVDWLVSAEVQASIPDNMFMFPVDAEVELPELWAQWATVTEDPIVVHPDHDRGRAGDLAAGVADIPTG